MKLNNITTENLFFFLPPEKTPGSTFYQGAAHCHTHCQLCFFFSCRIMQLRIFSQLLSFCCSEGRGSGALKVLYYGISNINLRISQCIVLNSLFPNGRKLRAVHHLFIFFYSYLYPVCIAHFLPSPFDSSPSFSNLHHNCLMMPQYTPCICTKASSKSHVIQLACFSVTSSIFTICENASFLVLLYGLKVQIKIKLKTIIYFHT